MEANEQQRFDTLYAQHLRALKLRGYSASTIDVYARAVRGLTEHFDCVPDQLSIEQLEIYFAKLIGCVTMDSCTIMPASFCTCCN